MQSQKRKFIPWTIICGRLVLDNLDYGKLYQIAEFAKSLGMNEKTCVLYQVTQTGEDQSSTRLSLSHIFKDVAA